MASTVNNIKLALSSSFFDAINKLPKNIFKKTKEFMESFPQKAMSSGFNYETIKNAKEQNYRSVRLNDNYRAIIYHPDEGNVYILLWVDTHENAYKWACSHVCKINNYTSSLQVYETLPVDNFDSSNYAEKIPLSEESRISPIFNSISDADLLYIGVPEELLSYVRKLTSKSSLENNSSLLPKEAYEALVWLADGESIEEVKSAYTKVNTFETADVWENALNNAQAIGSVRVIEDDEDMRAIVDADLAAWRVFLHPYQRKIVNADSLAPTLVRGSAGTGKTVVALHRAVKIVQRPDWDRNKKLLLTTFTTNLATDLEQAIRMICPRELKNCIEVTNIDKWVSNYLKRMQISLNIVYPDQANYINCWDRSFDNFDGTELPFSQSFYKEEFYRVILPQEITTEQQYLRAVRKGRGRVISRTNRKQIWPLFEEMRVQLHQENLITIEDACFLAIKLIKEFPSSVNYGAVIVDETQDLSSASLKLLSLLGTPKNGDDEESRIFLVGDGHQRIYSRTSSLSECNINIRGRRSKKLRITYRTTEEIRRTANSVLANVPIDDMDEGSENFNGDTSLRHGTYPEIKGASSFNEEADWVLKKIAELTSESSAYPYETKDICIVARQKKDLKRYMDYLGRNLYDTVEIKPRESDDTGKDGLRFATMHRIKGLEFKIIFLVNASKDVIPLNVTDFDDEIESQNYIKNERSLFYVSSTRARDALFISYIGKPSEFLENLVQ